MNRTFLSAYCAILMVALCSVNGNLYAQQHPLLESFKAIQIKDEVRLDFGIKGGSSCQGVQLERSLDGDDYEVVDLIPGVCGGSEFIEYYAVYDSTPVKNQLMYYRLELGQQGITTPLTFRYIPLKNGINIYPNPSSSAQEVRISNPFRLSFTVLVLSPLGEEIVRIPSLNLDTFLLDSSELGKGIYLVKIFSEEGGNEIYTSRIVRVE